MTAAPVIDPIEIRALGRARRTGWEHSVLALTALGLIAGVVRFMSFQATRSEFTEELVPRAVAQSQLYYFAHTAQIALLICAGVIALLCIDSRTIQRGYRLRFAMFIGAAMLMTVRGYTLSDLLSTKLADSTGPLPCFISVLLFVGVQRRNWNFLGKAMVILAVLLSTMVLWQLAGLQTFTRAEVGARLGSVLNALYGPAAWIALTDYSQASYARRVRFVPIMIFTLGSFLTQSRLPFVMIFALLMVYSYLQYKRKRPQAATWVVGVALAVWLSLFTNIFLRDTRIFHKVETVGEAFYSRLSEDTRTGQLIWFARTVQPHELLLGRGSFATWLWGSFGEYNGGTDVGYLTLLFYGGLPLLITYIATHLAPCLIVLRRKPSSLQLTAGAVVLLWGIRMLSSSYIGLGLDHYPILFCVGACISRERS